MENDTLLTCLRQRVILMTGILDLTKQMEVQSKQNIPQMDDLLRQRQACMDRIDKCNALIQKEAASLQLDGYASLPHLLAGDAEQAVSDEDFEICSLVQTNRELLHSTITIDANAVQRIQEQKEFMRGKVNNLRFARSSPKPQ